MNDTDGVYKIYWTQNRILILFPNLSFHHLRVSWQLKILRKKIRAFIFKTHINIYFRTYARSPQPPKDWAELQSQRPAVSREQQPCRCRFTLTKGLFPSEGVALPPNWNSRHCVLSCHSWTASLTLHSCNLMVAGSMAPCAGSLWLQNPMNK